MTPYQISVIVILFISMCANLGVVFVVSSKYYAARYISKDEMEGLVLQDKIRRFMGEMVFTDEADTKRKFKEFVDKDNERKGKT